MQVQTYKTVYISHPTKNVPARVKTKATLLLPQTHLLYSTHVELENETFKKHPADSLGPSRASLAQLTASSTPVVPSSQ